MKYYSPRPEETGKSLLEILKGNTVHDAPCGGRGSCGKCLVRVKGELSLPTEHEKALLGKRLEEGYRLACLTHALGDFSYDSAESSQRVVTDFKEKELTFTGKGKALAVDIGTTTVAIYALDLESGKITGKAGLENPQRIHGADVISRIDHALAGGGEELREEICNAISEAADRMLGEKPSLTVVCANTAMEHFAMGLDVSGIAKLPFTPASLFGERAKMPFCDNTYMAPCVAAYVGGDITLGAMACDIDRVEELTLYIDIGTNGEIVLADRDRILACAAAAGPAFEGANIECGMSASAGAVCRVWTENGELRYETVDGGEAAGICGSALIDFASALLELEELDETGRTEEDRYYLNEKVYLSQKDVRALQLAKAAIAAGIKTLLNEAKKQVKDIKKVIIAGGFGMHISPESACSIGLIPDVPRDSIEFAGNCAGLGAVSCALDPEKIKRAEALAGRIEYIELSGHKKFNELYIEEMIF